MRKGIAYLPLHYGDAPIWLFSRMKKLAREISIVLVDQFGTKEFLTRLSDPFWFQSFGCLLGFDWHSSGLTTTVCAALKEGLSELQKDLGLFIAGGKGKRSRETPEEIERVGESGIISTEKARQLIYASRMSAKVDNAALQDGYQIYQHCFIFTPEGDWAVIQQGMNTETRMARRYHWLGERVDDFVNEPHAAICCDAKGKALNMVAQESAAARKSSVELIKEPPKALIKELATLKKLPSSHHHPFAQLPILSLPSHHPIYPEDFDLNRLDRTLHIAYEHKPQNFEQLLGLKGIGPKTIRALALISELLYGTPVSWRDPVKFSFAHGGKDGYPFPVDRKTYDLSIQILKDAISKAKLNQSEKLQALKRLTGTI